MNKIVVFDTSSIITIVTNNLSNILKNLKKNVRFFISKEVKKELVDYPIRIKRFKLEAMQVMELIDEGIFEVSDIKNKINIMDLANNIFYVKKKPLNLLHKAEIDSLILCEELNADCYIVDERTMRLFIEDIKDMKSLLENKLHVKVDFNASNYQKFREKYKNIKILRSSELMVVAYEKRLMNGLISHRYGQQDQIDALLWGLRLRGCAISTEEIDLMKNIVKKQ